MKTSCTPLHSPETFIAPGYEALATLAVEGVNPLLPAEALPLPAIEQYYDEAASALAELPARRLAATVSRCVEVSLSPDIDETESLQYLQKASALTDEVVYGQKTAPYIEVLETSLLDTFKPAFSARRHQADLTTDVITDIYKGIGSLIDEVLAEPLAEKNRVGFEAKLAILGLGARCGYMETLYYPPTTRESRNAGNNHQLNHSLYALDDIAKIPVRVRYSHKPIQRPVATGVLCLSYSDIVNRAARDARLTDVMTPQHVLKTIRDEAAGVDVSEDEPFLDELSDIVSDQILNADLVRT